MRTRFVMTLLLVVAISLATTVPTASASANLQGSVEDEAQLAPEEEREARDLAQKFDDRFRATNDIGPIIDELFINDLSERSRQAPQGWLPWALLDKSLALAASRDVLRRHYVAVMNFYGLYYRLEEVTEYLRKQSDNSDGELDLENLLSPEVLSVLLSDPTFRELAELDKKDESDARAKENQNDQPAESIDSAQAAPATTEADGDAATEKIESSLIKNLAQLNAFSDTLEKAAELMRKQLASMAFIPPTPPGDNDGAESEQHTSKPNLISLDKGEFGYAQGTPAIHVDVLPFCLLLTRVDGQLKILSVSIYID